jgi:hypothetical protein
MTLLKTFLEIVRGWHAVFPQKRSSMRAIGIGAGPGQVPERRKDKLQASPQDRA